MRIIVVLIILMANTINVVSQNGWTIEERCMDDLSYPIVRQGDWDFEGIIVSSASRYGIHAIRDNIEYYIALESDHSFPAVGSISPDGQYFAYPIGKTQAHSYNTQSFLSVSQLRVVRVDGNTSEVHHFDATDMAWVFTATDLFGLRKAIWFGPQWIYDAGSGPAASTLVNIDTQQQQTLPFDTYPLKLPSPDGTRAFIRDDSLYNIEENIRLDYPTPWAVTWFADSSAFIVTNETGIIIIDRDGKLIETIDFDGGNFFNIAISPNGKSFAIWDWNEGRNLYIADIEQRTIYDLCFQNELNGLAFHYPNLAWSPDNQYLAFSYDDYLVILDTETLENQVLDHYSVHVMAWVSSE